MLTTPSIRAIGLASLLFVSGCNAGGGDNDAVVDEQVLNSTLLPDLPRPLPALDRRGLLEAVAGAASAYSLHGDDREAQAQLVNRKFSLRLPFGCGAVEANGEALRVAVRPDGQTLELSAAPDVDADDLGPESRIEQAEGFWIPRPWVLSSACPAVPPPASEDQLTGLDANDEKTEALAVAPLAAEHSVAFIQFFTDSDSRLGHRDGRAYSKVVPTTSSALPAGGLAMLVEGRLRPFPTGQVIRCKGDGARARPTCFISVQIDRVAFEKGADQQLLAEWHD